MFFLPDFYRAWCVQHVSCGDETHIKAITIDKGLMLDLTFFCVCQICSSMLIFAELTPTPSEIQLVQRLKSLPPAFT